jgi:murein DD-endopeptidase MepM/ murein hydrolase activator NlpD
MNHPQKNLVILSLALGVLLLATLGCAVTDSPAVKTAVAEVGQTALAKGEEFAKTEAAKALTTLEAAAKTQAYNAFGTIMSGGGTTTRIPAFTSPVAGTGYTTSTTSTAHAGVDAFAVDYIMSAEGAEIHPVLAGTIVFSGYETDYGNVVVIRHQSSDYDLIYYSVYAHLQAGSLLYDGVTSADGGVTVDPSAVIGRMGNTGNMSYGIVHLHFAVRTSGYLQEGLTALYGDTGQAAFDFRPYMTPFP